MKERGLVELNELLLTDAHALLFVSAAENPYIKDRLTRLAEDGSQKMRSTVSRSMSLSFDSRI